MTSINGDNRATAGRGRPVLVVVDDQESTRGFAANSLRRRFGSDYEVVVPGGTEAARSELGRLRGAGADAALIVANEHLTTGTGTDFLATTRDIYPTARRLVLADFGDNSVMPSIAHRQRWARSTTSTICRGARSMSNCSPRQRHPGRLDLRKRPRRLAMTIVGERGDPTSALLGEVLSAGRPIRFHDRWRERREGRTFLARARDRWPAAYRRGDRRQVPVRGDGGQVSDMVGAG